MSIKTGLEYIGYIDPWTDEERLSDEEIVRCRDCDHRRRSWNGRNPNFTSHFFCAYTGGHEVKPDGFCYRGVRRDE